MKLKIVFLTLIFASLLSCKKQKTAIEFEQEVFYSVFNEIVDSVYIDRKLFLPPPFWDKEKLEIHNKEIAEYKKDTSKRVVAIYHSVKGFLLNEELKKKLIDFDLNDSLNFFKSFKIDLSKINNQKLVFKYRSEFPENYNIWYGKYNFNLAGEVYFSRIIFNKSNTKAYLQCGYSCGEKAGQGFDVYIKKEKDKWVVEKIINTWIS